MVQQIKVATANTFWGLAARQPGGLTNLEAADILLLQEVISPTKDRLDNSLSQAGFTVLHVAGRFGLAIAMRSTSGLQLIPESIREFRLQKMSPVERVLARIWAKRRHELKERGMISLKLMNQNGTVLTIVNVHPGIDIEPRRRVKQIGILGVELQDEFYDGALIIGGDMNHSPGPKPIDHALLRSAGLNAVDLGKQKTWIARGSQVEKFIRLSRLFNHKSVDDYDGQLDTILYRGPNIQVDDVQVITIPSDHRAILASFLVTSLE